jgi:hypothetical protein
MVSKLKPIAFALAVLPAISQAQHTPDMLETYCIKCHNFEDWAGKLDMGVLDFDNVAHDAEIWELLIRKIRVGMMPPVGEDRPSAEVVDAFATEVENRLDEAVQPVPFAPALHRLNRNEYANAIRDIFGMDVDTTVLLPQDDAIEGFDNIAAGLGFSPALIQGYASAAMKISRWVVGDMTTTESAATFNAPADLAQDKHLEGMPLGTRGGMKIEHFFPLDAEYEFVLQAGRGFRGTGTIDTIVMLDGKRLEVENVNKFRIPVPAGQHTLTVALLDKRSPAGINDIYSEYSVAGAVSSVEIIGPFNATGPGHTHTRERIFSCYPTSNDEERSCAEQILVDISSQAFREPVTVTEVEPIMAFFEQGLKEGNFETGIQQMLSRVLIDPRFLFRFEDEPADLAPGTVYQISDLELASRLSFFLWSSIPDNELIGLAEQGTLSDPAVLQQQVVRMLNDPKAQALVDNFAGQWLFLRQLAGLTPEASDWDENLREGFIQETQLLFANVMAENRPVTELLNADYTFLNERLAKHYGIEGVRGSWFRKVPLAEDSPRRGLLGQGSILTITSTASRTSPVIRGSWILENILHAPVPAPPPGVETNLDGDGTVVLTTSVRERLEKHRADPVCSSCHSVIDPVGFALENFGPIGAWRLKDGDSPVDPTGTMADGTKVGSPNDLRNAVMGRSRLFVTTMTEKLMTYALGRALEYHDMPTVRSIMRESADSDYRFTDLVTGIVLSPQFNMRVKAEAAATAAL